MTLEGRPRVVVLVENLPVPLDRRTWQEAKALAQDGWDVTVIGPRGAGEMRQLRDVIDGIEILRYPQRAASGLAGYAIEYLPSMVFTAFLLVRTRGRGPIRVIHGCNPPDLFWLFGRVVRAGGGHFVFDQHDANVELSETKWGDRRGLGRVLRGLTAFLERRSYRTSSLVIVPNDSYQRIATGRGGLPENRVAVVRNAPDVAQYRSLAAGVTPDPRRVGYVGVMGSQDGLDLLLDAWALVVGQPDLADAMLELVGDGEARRALEAQAHRLGIDGSVRFHGYQPPDVFVPLLAGCLVGVSPDPPTPFNDVSTMVKVVDYLAIGRPVVAFPLAETRLVADEAGAYADEPTAEGLARAITDILRDPARAASMAKRSAGRISVLELDWAQSAARLRAAYRPLAGD